MAVSAGNRKLGDGRRESRRRGLSENDTWARLMSIPQLMTPFHRSRLHRMVELSNSAFTDRSSDERHRSHRTMASCREPEATIDSSTASVANSASSRHVLVGIETASHRSNRVADQTCLVLQRLRGVLETLREGRRCCLTGGDTAKRRVRRTLSKQFDERLTASRVPLIDRFTLPATARGRPRFVHEPIHPLILWPDRTRCQ